MKRLNKIANITIFKISFFVEEFENNDKKDIMDFINNLDYTLPETLQDWDLELLDYPFFEDDYKKSKIAFTCATTPPFDRNFNDNKDELKRAVDHHLDYIIDFTNAPNIKYFDAKIEQI